MKNQYNDRNAGQRKNSNESSYDSYGQQDRHQDRQRADHGFGESRDFSQKNRSTHGSDFYNHQETEQPAVNKNRGSSMGNESMNYGSSSRDSRDFGRDDQLYGSQSSGSYGAGSYRSSNEQNQSGPYGQEQLGRDDSRGNNQNFYRNAGGTSPSMTESWRPNDYDQSRTSGGRFQSGDLNRGSDYRANSPYGQNINYAEANMGAPRYEADQYSRSEQSSGSMSKSSRQGLHSGKAPKGYKRSDERIREDVCEALSSHHEIDASEIDVSVKDGMVTLSGTVESRQMKRMTEDTIDSMSGVSDVKNDLRVMSSSSEYSQSGNSDSKNQSSKMNSPRAGQSGTTSTSTASTVKQ